MILAAPTKIECYLISCLYFPGRIEHHFLTFDVAGELYQISKIFGLFPIQRAVSLNVCVMLHLLIVVLFFSFYVAEP